MSTFVNVWDQGRTASRCTNCNIVVHSAAEMTQHVCSIPIVEWDKEVKPELDITRNDEWRTHTPKKLQTLGEMTAKSVYDPVQYYVDVGTAIERMLNKLVALSSRGEQWIHLFTVGVAVIERRYGVRISLSSFTPSDMIEGEAPTAQVTITPLG